MRYHERGGAFLKRGGAFLKKTSLNGGEVIESFLFENLGFRYKKTASRKRGGAEFLDQKDLVSDLRSAFSTSSICR
jgi:hypothetical protein